MSRILTRSQYLDTVINQSYTKYTGIKANEAFSNDVNWGDSWVGRMINSIIRKGKVSVNLRRIDSLGKRLESLFDELVESGKIISNNATKSFITTSCLLGQLEDMVKGKKGEEGTEEEIPNIISHITFLIGQVQSYNLRDKDELINVLEEFQRYLQGLLKEKGSDDESDESGDESESDQSASDKSDKSDPNQIFFQESKKFLQSIVDLHSMIKNNVVRFSEEEFGKKINVGLQFDLEKFNSLKSTYEKSKPENKLSILRQLVPMIEAGLDSYKVKKDKANITLFDSYFKKYSGILSGMERDSLDKNKKKDTPIDGLKNLPKTEKTPLPTKRPVGEIAKELENKWMASQKAQGKNVKPGEGTRLRFQKEAEKIANESLLFEEVEQNLEKSETHARNAWKKVVDAYNKSGIVKFIPQIEELLSTGLKDGKEKTIQAKKNIITVCKQVLNNKSTVGSPIPFDNLIKEGVYDSDMPKSISLLGKTLLSFSEDLGLASAYGSKGRDKSGQALGTNPIKIFVDSFNVLEKTLPKINTTKTEYKAGDTVKYKLSKGGEGQKEIIKIEGDRFFFISKDGGELSSPLKSIISKVEKKQESVIRKYDNFKKIFEKTGGVDYDEVSDKFDELFTDEIIDKFQIEESMIEEVKRLGKEGDTIVITGADPIMEIVRLFQRAWRMHTPGIIPSGRGGGKVSSSVFMEYEYMGKNNPGTPDSPGSGPYRNIELYEKWNEAVTNILSNTKYRTTIFSDDAKFSWNYKEKTEEAVDKTNFTDKSGDDVTVSKAKPLGKILLRFINRLLADSEMYTSGGALPKFLDEYFSLSDDDLKKLGGTNFSSFKEDGKKNNETSVGMPTQTKCKFVERTSIKDFITNDDIFKFISEKVRSNNTDDIKNMLVKFTTDKPIYLLFLGISGTDKSKFYFLMLDSMFFNMTNFYMMSTTDITTRQPTTLDLIEVKSSERLITNEEITFNKWSLLSQTSNSEEAKIKPTKITILVDSKLDVFLDLKLDKLKSKYDISKKIKKIKTNLI